MLYLSVDSIVETNDVYVVYLNWLKNQKIHCFLSMNTHWSVDGLVVITLVVLNKVDNIELLCNELTTDVL